MPRTPERRDDDLDDDGDDWGDSDELPEGVYSDDDLPTVPCPYCRREVSEEAQWCPHCENYLSKEDAPPAARRGLFWAVMTALALGIVAWWVLR